MHSENSIRSYIVVMILNLNDTKEWKIAWKVINE